MLVFAAVVPHPPFSIFGVGEPGDKNKIIKTMRALEKMREELEKAQPDTIIVISPHAKMEQFAFAVNASVPLRGSLAEFGLDMIVEFENDVEIVDALGYAGEMREFPVYLQQSYLDHGALVPLFHLTRNFNPKIVHLAFSMLDLTRHYEYGEIMGHIAAQSGKRVAIIASGDLSHRLTPDSPMGYSPNAEIFDRRIIGILRQHDFAAVLALQKDFIQEAAECGLRSFVILLGALAKYEKRFDLLSYEAPFGIGYLVARLL